ncbi:MAG: hypothetical protein KDA21_13040, partial [Phycisphaerales bacterium]|nr:hypothetical protein [Phycisphaerales bacterium]
MFGCIAAVSVAGLSMVTGVTPCSLMGSCATACPDSSSQKTENIRLVANTGAEKGEAKSCCALGQVATVAAVKAAPASECSGAEATCHGSQMRLVGGRFPIAMPASFQAKGDGACTAAAQFAANAAKTESCCK